MLLIMPDGAVIEMMNKSPGHLKSAVGGVFKKIHLNDDRILIINEEAEEMGYALNFCASILLVAGGARAGDYIVGPAVFCECEELD